MDAFQDDIISLIIFINRHFMEAILQNIQRCGETLGKYSKSLDFIYHK